MAMRHSSVSQSARSLEIPKLSFEIFFGKVLKITSWTFKNSFVIIGSEKKNNQTQIFKQLTEKKTLIG